MNLPWIPANFLALPPAQSNLAQAGVVLIPVPYDSTTSFRSGAREGPAAIIESSYGLEDYDWEQQLDVSQVGIHTTPALEPHTGDPAQWWSGSGKR
jgi:agmatinase